MKKCLMLRDHFPVGFRGNDLCSSNLGDGVVFRIIGQCDFFCPSLLYEDIISWYQRLWFSMLLPVGYFFGSQLTCSACVSDFLFFDKWRLLPNIMCYGCPLKSRNAGCCPVVLCGVTK